MMNKLLSALLVFCLAFSLLTGCGGRASDNDKDEPKKSEKSSDDNSGGNIDVDLEDLGIDLDIDLDELEKYDTGTSYDSVDYKVSVDLPEGWKESENSSPSTLVSYEKMDEKTFNFVMFTVYKPTASLGSKSIEQWAKDNAEAIMDIYEDAKTSEIESTTIAGCPAARYDLFMNFAGIEQIQVYVYLVKDGKVIMVTGAYWPEDEQGAKEVEDILASMKIE